MTNANLLEVVRDFKMYKQMADEAEAMMEQLKAIITAEMEMQGVDKMNVDVFTIKNTPITSSRFNQTAFKKDNEELYNDYKQELNYRRFSVA